MSFTTERGGRPAATLEAHNAIVSDPAVNERMNATDLTVDHPLSIADLLAAAGTEWQTEDSSAAEAFKENDAGSLGLIRPAEGNFSQLEGVVLEVQKVETGMQEATGVTMTRGINPVDGRTTVHGQSNPELVGQGDPLLGLSQG
jgi:hypothetical protein